jgi:hypothetical protein
MFRANSGDASNDSNPQFSSCNGVVNRFAIMPLLKAFENAPDSDYHFVLPVALRRASEHHKAKV